MKRHLVTTDADGRLYLLGTDINGRDVFSRLLFGGRISMTIGFFGTICTIPYRTFYMAEFQATSAEKSTA